MLDITCNTLRQGAYADYVAGPSAEPRPAIACTRAWSDGCSAGDGSDQHQGYDPGPKQRDGSFRTTRPNFFTPGTAARTHVSDQLILSSCAITA